MERVPTHTHVAAAAPLTLDKVAKAPAVEQKLHGAWMGDVAIDAAIDAGIAIWPDPRVRLPTLVSNHCSRS